MRLTSEAELRRSALICLMLMMMAAAERKRRGCPRQTPPLQCVLLSPPSSPSWSSSGRRSERWIATGNNSRLARRTGKKRWNSRHIERERRRDRQRWRKSANFAFLKLPRQRQFSREAECQLGACSFTYFVLASRHTDSNLTAIHQSSLHFSAPFCRLLWDCVNSAKSTSIYRPPQATWWRESGRLQKVATIPQANAKVSSHGGRGKSSKNSASNGYI